MPNSLVESLETRRLLAPLLPLVPDLSFGREGFVGQTGGSLIYSVIGLQPDGRPIVQRWDNAGPRIQQYTYLQRLHPNGTVDATYNGGPGVRETDGGRGEVLIDHRGRAIWAQSYDYDPSPYGEIYVATLSRLDANGSPDPAFGKNGRMIILLQTSPIAGRRVGGYFVQDLAIDSRGRTHMLLSVSCVKANDRYDYEHASVIIRTTESGRFDPTFGDDGFVHLEPGPLRFNWNGDNSPRMNFDPQGRILVAGQIGEDTLVAARFTAEGALDTTYGTAGVVSTPAGSEPYISNGENNNDDPVRFNFDPVGGIVYADYEPTWVETGTPHVFRRIDVDGQTDTSFGDNGVLDFTEPYSALTGFDADGNMVFRFDQEVRTYTFDGDLVDQTSTPPDLPYYPDGDTVVDAQGRQYINSPDGRIARLVEAKEAEYDGRSDVIRVSSLNASDDLVLSRSGRRVVIERNGEIILRVTDPVTKIVVRMNVIDDTLRSTANLPLEIRENERSVIFEIKTFPGEEDDVISVDETGIDLGNGISGVQGGVWVPQTFRAGAGRHTFDLSGPYSYYEPQNIRSQPLLTMRLTGGSYDVRTSRLNTDIVFDTAKRTYLRSQGGNDRVSGGSNNDSYDVGNGTDYVYGNAGNDVITSRSTTHSYLAGGPGDDTIHLRAKSLATLDGGSGDDTLRSAGGASQLLGGKGRDVFFTANARYDALDGGEGSDTAYVDDDDIVTSIEQLR